MRVRIVDDGYNVWVYVKRSWWKRWECMKVFVSNTENADYDPWEQAEEFVRRLRKPRVVETRV